MIIIAHKSRMKESILKKYPDAHIVDVTSKAEDAFVRLSPFYAHGGIPIPFSEGEVVLGQSVEGIWQGLKVFETEDIDVAKFEVRNMKGLKRTVRKFGKCLGHRKGVKGEELLGYIEARKQLYVPLYLWILTHKVSDLLAELRAIAEKHTLVLLDYEVNGNIEDPSKPLSHAHLIKMYLEGGLSVNN
ncbi:MAG: DUF6939 family protein [Bacteroidia bacterium]